MHIMIDLETMGNTPDAPIVAIGACRFDRTGVSEESAFYETISLASAVDGGAKMEASTVLWWMEQDAAAQAEIIGAKSDLSGVLCDFTHWVKKIDADGVWGNGAAFDNVILAQTYRRYGQPAPWPFWLDRCYRTVKSLSKVPIDRQGTHHNALDDAISQAKHLVEIWDATP